MDRIIWAAPNGGVSITHPNEKYMRAFQNGGVGVSPPEAPNSDVGDIIAKQGETRFASIQIGRWAGDGVGEDVARRYTKALFSGGCTEAEAFGIIKDKDTFRGRGHVRAPAPVFDRFFRDAWVLIGGKIVVDMTKARAVFARRLIVEKSERVVAITTEIEIALVTGTRADRLEATIAALQAINLRALGDKVAKAETPEALKSLWPENLQTPPVSAPAQSRPRLLKAA